MLDQYTIRELEKALEEAKERRFDENMLYTQEEAVTLLRKGQDAEELLRYFIRAIAIKTRELYK